MIKNDRQYRITKAQANSFSKALAELETADATERERDPLRFSLQQDAVRAQLDDLQRLLQDYDALRANPGSIEADFDDLPRALIRARIAGGLSHQELAARLGLKEQQIQRYEATEYEGVSIDRIRDICRALGVRVHNELVLPTAPRSLGHVLKKLHSVGLHKDFVQRRLILPGQQGADANAIVDSLADVLGRVFNWTPEQLCSSRHLTLDNAVLESVRYKAPARAAIPVRNAYTIYAHYLALLVLQSVGSPTRHQRPSAPMEIYRLLSKGHDSVSLDAVLNFVWSQGIPVLPLRDQGAFHGAWWRVDGRDVIVVKQTTDSSARWIIDILHEYFHAVTEPSADDAAVVEETDSAGAASTSDVEQAATEFAVSVALGGRQEELAAACVKAARGKVEWLKGVVPRVATNERVDVAMLANYLAYRLSFQGINWWPTAKSLQGSVGDPWSLATEHLRSRITPDALAPIDRDILMQALAEG